MRERVEQLRNTVCFKCFAAPKGPKNRQIHRQADRQIEREGEIDKETQREGDKEIQRERGRPQPPFGPSVGSLCHPCITTTHRSYSFLSLKLPPPPCAVLCTGKFQHHHGQSIQVTFLRCKLCKLNLMLHSQLRHASSSSSLSSTIATAASDEAAALFLDTSIEVNWRQDQVARC